MNWVHIFDCLDMANGFIKVEVKSKLIQIYNLPPCIRYALSEMLADYMKISLTFTGIVIAIIITGRYQKKVLYHVHVCLYYFYPLTTKRTDQIILRVHLRVSTIYNGARDCM